MKHKKTGRVWLFLCILVLFLTGCSVADYLPMEDTTTAVVDGNLTVQYLDVGQGDATLIQSGGEAMLIDAGNNDKGTQVQNYLQKQGVTRLKYVIGTHPDADHIGGLDVIITKFDCETVLMPDVTADTATYRDVVSAMKYKRYTCTHPDVGDTYKLGNAVFTILSPAKKYSSNNNNSIALRLVYGKTSFLFTGDAAEEAEDAMLAGGQTLASDVYKVGHHGSRYSSSEAFLSAVKPAYAVISCGDGNSYGHPHDEVLNRLRQMGTAVYRTDDQGTIVAESDGKTLTFTSSPSGDWTAGEPQKKDASEKTATKSAKKQTRDTTETYVCNTSTKKFHRPDCRSVSTMKEENKKTVTAARSELIADGYSPCQTCNP